MKGPDEMLCAALSGAIDDVPELGNNGRAHAKALSKLRCVHPVDAEDFARKRHDGRRLVEHWVEEEE